MPELPKDVPASAAKYTVTIMGTGAGQQAVRSEGDAELYRELGVRSWVASESN